MPTIHYTASRFYSFVVMIILAINPLLKSETTNKLSSQVDQMFSKWNKSDSPGFAVGIVHDGKLVHRKGYGMANLDHKIPIDSSTVFEIASVTKSITTASFALFLDGSDVKLDDDVRKYIPELPKLDPPIKVRHLLRCESGLRDYYVSLQLAGWNILDFWTEKDVLQLITAQKSFDFQPGERFSYSNSDFLLLALIIKRVTGKSLADFADLKIFRPLKMTRTFYATDPSIVVSKRATGYQRKWRTGRYHKFELNSGTIGPFGLKTTVEDLYRWDQNLSKNKLPAGSHFKEFLRTGCLIGNRMCLEAFPERSYRGVDRHWYTGGMPGFMAQFVRFPKHRLAIILLCNISDREEWNEMTINAKRIADLYLADQLHAKPKKHPRSKPKIAKVPQDKLRKLTGSFRKRDGLEKGFVAYVSIKRGQLVFRDHFGRETRLVAVSPSQFQSTELTSNRTFTFSTKGREQSILAVKTGSNLEQHYEKISIVKPTKKQLATYVGRYYCPELLTTYFIIVNNNHLFLRINNRRKEELAPTIFHEFVPKDRPTTDEGRILSFSQHKNGKPMRLKVRLWRSIAEFERVSE